MTDISQKQGGWTPGQKLTAKQIETLLAVSLGNVACRNMGHSAWRIVGASPTVVGRLVSLGLVRWTNGWMGDARLTEMGEVALSRANPSTDQGGE